MAHEGCSWIVVGVFLVKFVRDRLLPLLLVVAAIQGPSLLSAQEPPEEQQPSVLLLDRNMSIRASATSFQALADGVYALEDRWLPLSVGGGEGVAGFGGLLYRFARLNLLDNPISVLHAVGRHEIAGHGGRIRGFGGDVLNYQLKLPPPYGDGGGSTTFDFEGGTPHELALVMAGGLESAQLDQLRLEERWVFRGEMDFREALQYMWTGMEITGYIGSATGGAPSSGHDVENYIALVNASVPDTNGGSSDVDDSPGELLTASRLHAAAVAEVLNPVFFYSMYAVFWRYVVRGEADGGIPAIDLGTVRTLPTIHLRLTPFGHEYAGGFTAAWREHVFGARVRMGDGPLGPFNGVEFEGRRLHSTSQLHLGGDMGLWRQYDLGGSTVQPRWGGMAMIRGSWDFTEIPVSAVAHLGYKTEGFTPGEALDAGVILRIGVAAEL